VPQFFPEGLKRRGEVNEGAIMDDLELSTMEEEQTMEEKPSAKRQFNDTLLAQLMWPTPVALPQGTPRRVYGVMSDTPMSRRTRLYQH
jgi:hypothetical protein